MLDDELFHDEPRDRDLVCFGRDLDQPVAEGVSFPIGRFVVPRAHPSKSLAERGLCCRHLAFEPMREPNPGLRLKRCRILLKRLRRESHDDLHLARVPSLFNFR